jgi:hypothetical protein
MKKSSLISIIAMVVIMVSLTSAKSLSNYSEEDIISINKAYGWKVSSVLQVDLKEGQSSYLWFKNYLAGVQYKVVAFSEDDEVTDVDLKIQYANGTLYGEDDDDSDMAIVELSPYYTRRLGVKVTNYASNRPYYQTSRCKFIIFFK